MPAAKWFLGAVAVAFSVTVIGAPLSAVATTSIVGDVVKAIGGEEVSLVVLFPPGTDPHTFEPTPRDLRALHAADVAFINGAGLEEGLAPILASPELRGKVVDLSAGLPLRALDGNDDHGEVDPHVWFDPLLVAEWTRTIEMVLGALDPDRQDTFAARAAAYRSELASLDGWIQAQVALLPAERRVLVTDHRVLGYFAARYGFAEAGAIVSGFSTLAEPSARDMAALTDRIHALGVPAVFVSAEFNPDLATQLARDTGTQVVVLFHGSLSAPDGPAPDYLSFMRENVRRIVEALRG